MLLNIWLMERLCATENMLMERLCATEHMADGEVMCY